MREKKTKVQITSIVIVCVLALLAIILRSVGLANSGSPSAYEVGLFISMLFYFSAAILVSLSGKELVGLLIVLFVETIPVTSGFVWQASGGTPFGDVIRNNPYGFTSFFILIVLIILLALVLAYKPTRADEVKRKWTFLPPIILFFYFLIFQAAGRDIYDIAFGMSLFFICIAITVAVTFNAALTGSLVALGALLIVPFHMGATLSVQKTGHGGYIITFWTIGLILMILSFVWFGYEVYYAIKHKKKA